MIWQLLDSLKYSWMHPQCSLSVFGMSSVATLSGCILWAVEMTICLVSVWKTIYSFWPALGTSTQFKTNWYYNVIQDFWVAGLAEFRDYPRQKLETSVLTICCHLPPKFLILSVNEAGFRGCCPTWIKNMVFTRDNGHSRTCLCEERI